MRKYSHTYGMEGRPYSVGSRVEIHPRFDLWMRGARFGTVRSIETTDDGKRISIAVKLDKVRKLFRCTDPMDLKAVR